MILNNKIREKNRLKFNNVLKELWNYNYFIKKKLSLIYKKSYKNKKRLRNSMN